MNENTIENRLRIEVERLGGKAYKFESNGNVGVPDRIVILPGGRVFFIELKRPKGGRFSRMQEFRMAELRSLGANVISIKTYKEVESFVRKAKEGQET